MNCAEITKRVISNQTASGDTVDSAIHVFLNLKKNVGDQSGEMRTRALNTTNTCIVKHVNPLSRKVLSRAGYWINLDGESGVYAVNNGRNANSNLLRLCLEIMSRHKKSVLFTDRKNDGYKLGICQGTPWSHNTKGWVITRTTHPRYNSSCFWFKLSHAHEFWTPCEVSILCDREEYCWLSTKAEELDRALEPLGQINKLLNFLHRSSRTIMQLVLLVVIPDIGGCMVWNLRETCRRWSKKLQG